MVRKILMYKIMLMNLVVCWSSHNHILGHFNIIIFRYKIMLITLENITKMLYEI